MMAICKLLSTYTTWYSSTLSWCSKQGIRDGTTGTTVLLRHIPALADPMGYVHGIAQDMHPQYNAWQHTIISGAEEPRAMRVKLATDAFQTKTCLQAHAHGCERLTCKICTHDKKEHTIKRPGSPEGNWHQRCENGATKDSPSHISTTLLRCLGT